MVGGEARGVLGAPQLGHVGEKLDPAPARESAHRAPQRASIARFEFHLGARRAEAGVRRAAGDQLPVGTPDRDGLGEAADGVAQEFELIGVGRTRSTSTRQS